MKFENVGKWMKEAEEDKLVFDNREPADYLNGDDEICTLKTEDDESDYDDDFSGELLDEVESDEDKLESPDNEEDAIIMADESAQKNEGSNWEYSVNVLDSYGDIQYSTTCNSQSDIDKAIKKYKDRAVELRNADGCKTIEVTKDLVNDDGDILKTQSIKKMSLESSQKNEGPEEFKTNEYKEDFFEYKNGGHGSFMEYLAKACMLADKKNLAKIQKEFPELTKSFCLWKSSGRTDKAEKL